MEGGWGRVEPRRRFGLVTICANIFEFGFGPEEIYTIRMMRKAIGSAVGLDWESMVKVYESVLQAAARVAEATGSSSKTRSL